MGPIAQVGAGAAGGVATDRILKKFHDWFEEEDEWEKFFHHFPQEWDTLCKHISMLAQVNGQRPLRRPITIWPTASTGAEGVPINREGRSYASLFTLSAIKIQLFVLGVGMYQPTTVAGWNSIGCPDGSYIALPSNATGPANVLMVYDDVNRGVAI